VPLRFGSSELLSHLESLSKPLQCRGVLRCGLDPVKHRSRHCTRLAKLRLQRRFLLRGDP
jgi:hypothetical protein